MSHDTPGWVYFVMSLVMMLLLLQGHIEHLHQPAKIPAPCRCQDQPGTHDATPVDQWDPTRMLDAELLGQDATWMPEDPTP